MSPRAVSSLKAERIHAYCTGTAFDRSTFRASLPQNGSISNHLAYSSGRIAWIDKRTSITHLLALEDSGACITNESDDDVLSHIGLSGSMMVVTTLSGQCRVTTRSEHRFQLSLTSVQSMVVANDTVAILHRPSNDLLQAGVTTWTLHDRTPVEFSAGLHRFVDQALGLCDLKIMLDAPGARVIMFERVTEARLVHFTRFGVDGQVQAGATLELPEMERYAKHSEEGTLNHTNEWATVWSYSKSIGESNDHFTDIIEVIRVQCHPNRGFLRLKKDSYEGCKGFAWPMSNIFFWNDIAYSQKNDGHGKTLLKVMDFSTSFHGIAFMGTEIKYECWALSIPELSQFCNAGGLAQSIFLGDQKFLVNVCQHGFFMWVFDKEHGMPEIDAGYRKEREEAKKSRSELLGPFGHLASR